LSPGTLGISKLEENLVAEILSTHSLQAMRRMPPPIFDSDDPTTRFWKVAMHTRNMRKLAEALGNNLIHLHRTIAMRDQAWDTVYYFETHALDRMMSAECRATDYLGSDDLHEFQKLADS